MNRLPLWLLAVLCFGFTLSNVAAEPAKTDKNKDDVVELSPFVVTAQSRGIVPLGGYIRYNLITGKITSPFTITGCLPRSKTLADYTVKKDEQVIAIAGQRLVGARLSDIRKLWLETGDAGELVKLTIKGTGEDASVFRELILKRIAPPKTPPSANPQETPSPTPPPSS